jgi:hypothetical protein
MEGSEALVVVHNSYVQFGRVALAIRIQLDKTDYFLARLSYQTISDGFGAGDRE